MINGEESIIKEKSLWSLNLINMKNKSVIKLSCDPKFSDLKIDDNKSKISVFESSTNSRFWVRLTFPKPSLYIVAGIYWYTDMLSASDIGRIEIKNKLKKIKIIIFSSVLKLKYSKDFRCLKFANVYKNWRKKTDKTIYKLKLL